jgi:hypothetical protein
MMNIKKPDVTLIAKFLEDNRGDTNDAEFAKRYVTGVIASLKVDKKLYRSFGGFWWPLKRMILTIDSNNFGEQYDTELNELFSYRNDALTVCAAFLTQQANMEQGYLYSNQHRYYTAGQEPIDLTIEDSEMEGRIFADSFV